MNKAFVKEQEEGQPYCPRCKSLGESVGKTTLDALLKPDARRQLAETASFCSFPTCSVAYFDAFDRTADVSDLVKSVYPKDAQAPICPCFGLTIEDIEADIDEGTPQRVRAHRAKAQSPEAKCSVLAANGKSCIPEVQKCYMRLLGAVLLFATLLSSTDAAELRGEIRDAESQQLVAARLMIQHADGRWFFAKSADPRGSAVVLDRERSKTSVEKHTCLTAHPFVAELPAGKYTLTIERGKEYLTETREIEVKDQPSEVRINLRRWINMAERRWFSGDTHVHRPVEELIAPMLAEDVNVVLPMTQWVTTSHTTPAVGNRSGVKSVSNQLVVADATHVIHPLNTEYELFTVGKKSHTLGAVLAINQQEPFELGAPPVAPIAQTAHKQGALLDLEKHSWPWSMMIVPVMNVDLFELSNNHIWRTEFAFSQWTIDTKLPYGNIETNAAGFTEWGWTDFGFQTYYTLLNCGFRLRPTAGTAFGVHPTPLGFGRVYVELPDGFRYADWIRGLDAGRSFVTTGPMLFAKFNGQPAGSKFQRTGDENSLCEVRGEITSIHPLDRIEVIVNGEIAQTLKSPANKPLGAAGLSTPLKIDVPVSASRSQWVVIRAFEQHSPGRFRFVHSSPVYFDVPGKPVRPRPEELKYVIGRIEQELARNKDLLNEAELDEYRSALKTYRALEPSDAAGK